MLRRASAANVLRLAAASIALGTVVYAAIAVSLIRYAEQSFAPVLTQTVPSLIETDRLGLAAFDTAALATRIIAAPDGENRHALIEALQAEVDRISLLSNSPSLRDLPELDDVRAMQQRIVTQASDMRELSTNLSENLPFARQTLDERVAAVKLLRDKFSREVLLLMKNVAAQQAENSTQVTINLFNAAIAELRQIQNILENADRLASVDDVEQSERLIKFHINSAILKISRIRNPAVRANYSEAARDVFIDFINGEALSDVKLFVGQRRALINSANDLVQMLNFLKSEMSEQVDRQRLATAVISEEITARLNGLRTLLFFGSLFMVLAILAIVFFSIENRVVRRLRQLGGQVEALSSGDLRFKRLLNGTDELAKLSGAVEDLRKANIVQRKLQQDLRTARIKAEEGSRTKSDFLSMMSHEVRTPLNAIMGLFEIIEGAASNERQKLRAKNGRKAAEGLFGMLSNVLEAARLETGRTEITVSDVNVKELERFVEGVLEGALSKSKTQVEGRVNFDPSLPEVFRTDEGFIQQIVVNLIDNAVRFTPQGHIEVRMSVIGPTTPSPSKERHFRLEVEDTGIGIAAENAELIFDRFHQVDGGITRKNGGSGLGLPITKRLAEQLGGRISFESDPPNGTTFAVEIPG